MSTRTSVEVYCDEPMCPRVKIYSGENRGGVNVSTALDRARQDGWMVRGHEAFCPEHRKSERCEFEGYVVWGHMGIDKTFTRRCSLRAGHNGKHRSKSYTLVAPSTLDE